jgi:predicted Zn-dependent protease
MRTGIRWRKSLFLLLVIMPIGSFADDKYGYEFYEKDGDLIIIDRTENRSFKFKNIKTYDNFRVRVGSLKSHRDKEQPQTKEEKAAVDLQEQGKKVDAQLREANQLYFKGQFQKCLQTLQEIEALSPNDYQIKTMMGSVYFKLNDQMKAKEYWQNSLKLNPAQPELVEKLKVIK